MYLYKKNECNGEIILKYSKNKYIKIKMKNNIRWKTNEKERCTKIPQIERKLVWKKVNWNKNEINI